MGLRPTDGDEERAKGGECAANRRPFFRGADLLALQNRRGQFGFGLVELALFLLQDVHGH